MADLLTHVLIGYAAATLLSRRYEWLTGTWVTIAMIGALLPDLDHVSMIVSAGEIHRALGVPFSWTVLQTGGGVLVTILVGTVLPVEHRRRVFALLWLGAGLHLFADVLVRVPDGRSQSVFWPLTQYQPPSPGLYLSTDLWPLLVAAALAFGSWSVARYQSSDW